MLPISRTIGLAGALLVAGPALSQSASVTVFGPIPSPALREEDGVETTMASAFALYEFGKPIRRGTTDPSSPAAPDSLAAARPVAARPCPSRYAPPRTLVARIARARRAYWPIIANAECRWRLPPGLMDSLVIAESGYDPFAISHAGAAGLAQLMPGTASDLGVSNRLDPVANIDAGARYLRSLLDGFGGNVPLALAAYNAGPAAVRRGGRVPANAETPGYVHRVLSLWSAPRIGPVSGGLSARQTAKMLGFYSSTTN
jgi:hypothetical protein